MNSLKGIPAYDKDKPPLISRKTEDRRYEVVFNCDVRISGDMLFMFYQTNKPKSVSLTMF